MSVSARIKELNKRLSQKLTAKGVEASETETTTSLINKMDNLPTGQNDIDFRGLTNWQHFSYRNNRNTFVEKLKYSDTSNGEVFSDMFYGCSELTTIPQIDTTKGTSFGYMFYGCSKLTTIPQINTSNGEVFNNMFSGCSKLTTIPQIDTTKGTSFDYMFYGCSELTTIPQIDTTKGTSFGYMFYGCSKLTTIPQINTSNGEVFNNMFSSCSALTNLTIAGSINTSGMNFRSATKLSKASITSVVNALSASASGKSITFSKTAIDSAFETSSGAADGSTSDEWLNLIATKSNWTISLV